MPTRIPSRTALTCLEGTLSGRPVVAQTPCSAHASPSTLAPRSQRSAFSTTASRDVNRAQRRMRDWMHTRGRELKRPKEGGGTNYLGPSDNRPFPNNPTFVSQPVLSEAAREAIWQAAMEEGAAIKTISARLSVDVRRVAAVIRLMEVQKRMEAEGQPMAKPYARAVMAMLPQTPFREENPRPHEPVNEIHVHSRTMQQLFVPTSESRHFTRADAAKAFGDHILPADERVALPELVQLERDVMQGKQPEDAFRDFEAATSRAEQALAEKTTKERAAQEAKISRVGTDRFEFRFQDYNAQGVGWSGRARNAVGWRYGTPFPDRKRGQVKIPTKVE